MLRPSEYLLSWTSLVCVQMSEARALEVQRILATALRRDQATGTTLSPRSSLGTLETQVCFLVADPFHSLLHTLLQWTVGSVGEYYSCFAMAFVLSRLVCVQPHLHTQTSRSNAFARFYRHLHQRHCTALCMQATRVCLATRVELAHLGGCSGLYTIARKLEIHQLTVYESLHAGQTASVCQATRL